MLRSTVQTSAERAGLLVLLYTQRLAPISQLTIDDININDVIGYLQRWALLSEPDATWAVQFLATPGMDTYVLSYDHGWRLLDRWLDSPDRVQRFRRLLTEPVLPADLA
ncbi:MAG: hypothetical protein ACRDRH_19555 [Pseudonocardia sp.]